MPLPVKDPIITSKFGARIHPVTGKKSFHTGLDIAGSWHSNIISVLDGIVTFSGVQNGYGNCIQIEHVSDTGEVFYTFYAHLAERYVEIGQSVLQGNVIAIQGGDPKRDPFPGTSTGTHLHFEIRKSKNGDFQDPEKYLYKNKE